jgi:D-serine deaminase-like pyridoxal phosphate-dependent protein
MDDEALARLRDDPIDWRYKGFPPALPAAGGVTVGSVGEQGWNLLARDLPTPVLVLRESALAHNLQVMARWCAERDASLAPHGKTTMSPELWARQLEAGAWGITAANVAQVRVMRAFGVGRIVLANELVEPAAVRWVAAELARDPGFELYCLVDSVEAVRAMTGAARRPARPIQALVELGVAGGRTGARTLEAAEQVAAAANDSPALELAGAEAFEGIIHGDGAAREVDELLDRLAVLARRLDLDGRAEAVVTAGGSAFFDRVQDRLAGVQARLVLRSGCYVTHDSGLYERISPFGEHATGGERLRHALEAWGVVLSRPEPDLALLLLGKRDVAYDIEPPLPLSVHGRDGLRPARSMTVFELNDQHAYLRLPPDDPLAVGDLVACGISHPCTAFDKWRLIPVVDDDYTVIDAVHTFF